MREWQDIFDSPAAGDGPGDGFEARVLAKIARKKRQRRAGLTAAAVALVLAGSALAVFQPLRRAGGGGAAPMAGKIEVPVSEHLYFSTSNSRTRYTLQPVALDGGSAAQPVVNQI